ncbi:hypothetical protein [Pyxidicoccus sp. MSG2]|uniref:hypothetical protein n=1 Tax=Pyxidicoccus sp. MSG2 TaxID=2996790 RepID=UPI00226E3BB5|nr:hypothetical protein [Pyxidicoccus sp. MSG2]MCY1022926.1 hypothetical protein [Pyxidicoccus sp. MSG2]
MSKQASRDSVTSSPAKAQPAPELIPTSDALIYGETIYLNKVRGDAPLWLSGGRSDGQTQVYTLDGENGTVEETYRWTVMKGVDTVGSGPVSYGDVIYLKVGGKAQRWLTGGRGTPQNQVSTRDGAGASEDGSYHWTVMQDFEIPGSGSVKRGSAICLKVGTTEQRWLSGGVDGQKSVSTLDGRDGKERDSYFWTTEPVSYSRMFAVFAEDSPETKYMPAGGMQPRVFTRVEARSPDNSIQLDLETGFITLPPGTYHITGFSTTAFLYPRDNPEEIAKLDGMVQNKQLANGGYCRLRLAGGIPEQISNDDAIAVGSISSANMIPSLIETWFTTNVDAQIVMEHQSGRTDQTADVVLRANPNDSPWHIFARLSISRV